MQAKGSVKLTENNSLNENKAIAEDVEKIQNVRNLISSISSGSVKKSCRGYSNPCHRRNLKIK